jgi:hypothetical protein
VRTSRAAPRLRLSLGIPRSLIKADQSRKRFILFTSTEKWLCVLVILKIAAYTSSAQNVPHPLETMRATSRHARRALAGTGLGPGSSSPTSAPAPEPPRRRRPAPRTMVRTLPPTYVQHRRRGEATLDDLLRSLSGIPGPPRGSNLAELPIYSFIP